MTGSHEVWGSIPHGSTLGNPVGYYTSGVFAFCALVTGWSFRTRLVPTTRIFWSVNQNRGIVSPRPHQRPWPRVTHTITPRASTAFFSLYPRFEVPIGTASLD